MNEYFAYPAFVYPDGIVAAGWACWCRKKLIEALQAGDKAVLAKFAADQSYTSSPQPIDGLMDAAQDSSSQPEPEKAGEINHIPVHPQSQNMQCATCHPCGPHCRGDCASFTGCTVQTGQANALVQ